MSITTSLGKTANSVDRMKQPGLLTRRKDEEIHGAIYGQRDTVVECHIPTRYPATVAYRRLCSLEAIVQCRPSPLRGRSRATQKDGMAGRQPRGSAGHTNLMYITLSALVLVLFRTLQKDALHARGHWIVPPPRQPNAPSAFFDRMRRLHHGAILR